ncbi:lytic transglycosylase, partial [Marinomonas sp. 42_23_T18]
MINKTFIAATFCFVLTGCQSLTSEKNQVENNLIDAVQPASDNIEKEVLDTNLSTQTDDVLIFPLKSNDVALLPAAIDDIPLPEEVIEVEVVEEVPEVVAVIVEEVVEEPLPPIDLWQRMQSGFSLDLELNKPRISSQLKWFVSHPSYLDRVSRRGSRYLYFIVEELEKANLP